MSPFYSSCAGNHEFINLLRSLFLEGPYADVIRTTICILLGVSPPMLFVIMFIDGFWGGFIHIGEQMVKKGKMGFMYKYILTPSHHRMHHAKNPLYMDTNFCNLLNIWDRAFGTYQEEDKNVIIEYGITRKMKPNSFIDSYFGEFAALARDVHKAPGIKNKIYIFLCLPVGAIAAIIKQQKKYAKNTCKATY